MHVAPGSAFDMAQQTSDAASAVVAQLAQAPISALDQLMRQALAVSGAATALLEAFAAQSRALHLVQEAEARGAASLPSELRHRLADVTRRTPTWLSAVGD